MIRRTLSKLTFWASICLLTSGIAWGQDGDLEVSGTFPVMLTFDKAGEVEEVEPVPATEEECTGGGLVGGLNCVTKKIEGAGGDGTGDRGSTPGAPGSSDVSVRLVGSITPKVSVVDDDTLEITFDVDIGVPSFSPAIGQIPRDIVERAASDERTLKTALKSWSVVLEKADLGRDPRQEHSFDSTFEGLTLFSILRPNNRVVNVFWRSADCGPLQEEYLAAQRAYQEAVAAMPVLDQFEVVTRTLDEINETLGESAKTLKENASKVGDITDKSPAEKKIEQLMDDTKGLSESLTGALDKVKEAIQGEREKLLEASGGEKTLNDLKGGLEKSAKTFEKVSKTIADMNARTRKLEELINASDDSASGQLRLFQRYFDDSRELVGGLVDVVPGLGQLLEMYSQAIGQIADSAERIEAVVNERQRLAAELGIPKPYQDAMNIRERAAREQDRLFDEMTGLGQRLALLCPGFDDSTEAYGLLEQMEDAAARARDACETLMPEMSEESRIRRDLDAARVSYYRDNPDVLRPLYRREKIAYEGLARRYEQLRANPGGFDREGLFELLDDVESFYTETRRISTYERVKDQLLQGQGLPREEMVDYGNHVASRLSRLNELERRLLQGNDGKEEYLAAKEALDGLRARQAEFRDCVDGRLRRLAEERGWSQSLVDALVR